MRLFLLCLFSLPLLAFAAPAANPPKPVAPPVVVPSQLDIVTFLVHTDGDNHKMIVTSGPGVLRVDEPDDRYSVIYNPQTDHYTGLEHGNDTYWEFSWPEVRDAVMASKRYEAHLQDLGNAGLSDSYAKTSPTDVNAASTGVISDNSGYTWKQTQEHKMIAGVDCTRWVGETVSGEGVEAWCYNGELPKVKLAMEALRSINEPMALVPIRTLVPPFVFTIYNALVRGGVTPVVITWGGEQDRNHFTWVETRTRNGEPGLFAVPKVYMKTTLVSMDGMIEQKK